MIRCYGQANEYSRVICSAKSATLNRSSSGSSTSGNEVEPENGVRVKSLSGELYAVTHTKLSEITPTRKKLVL